VTEHGDGEKQFVIRGLEPVDFGRLFNYLQNLSEETRRRFGPHLFDKESIVSFYNNPTNKAYIAQDEETLEIVAYFIVKNGIVEHDYQRFLAYGLVLDAITDCTFAPSVADLWQSSGVGSIMFQSITADLKQRGVRRIFLWGGVQAENERAVNYYKKFGFRSLGQFFHHGDNFDMVLDLI
jgi:ribosomal protein S18 acetylase RimI-like enzyme